MRIVVCLNSFGGDGEGELAPASERTITTVVVGTFQRTRLNKEYRRQFPDGKELTRIYWLAAIMFASLVGLLISLRSIFYLGQRSLPLRLAIR